jgi:hypothetical protein
MLRYVTLAVVLVSTSVLAQTPAQPSRVPEAAAAPALPVRRVVLYKTGVGYFEHLGSVRDRQNVAIRFTSAQLNDVLKSLTTIDLGRGQITGVSYNSIAPLEQRLGALRLPLDGRATTLEVLGSLRGARVEVSAPPGAAVGRLLSVERRSRTRGGDQIEVESLSIVTDAGEVRTFDLNPDLRVRIVERDLRQEVSRYLDVVGSAREQDVRTMTISTAGAGERQLFVSYVSEVPIWKSTYRLVFPSKGSPLLQGWAVVDNTIGEDWTNVELSLVAGAPQSFIQQISQPYYGRRPVVPLPTTAMLTPQTHQATLQSGSGTVAGRVVDASGSGLPGARVLLTGASGQAIRGTTDAAGNYSLVAPAGTYSLQFELAGFSPRRIDNITVSGGTSVLQNATLPVGALSESVTVTADGLRRGGRGSSLFAAPGGVVGGVVGGLPSAGPAPAPVYDQASALEAAAAGAELGDLFEYRIKEPVTLRKNQSALVPIVNAEITAEKVALWSRAPGSGRPLRAVWLTNASGLTLDGGSMTVIDGAAFAGEGLIEPLKPGERRLVSYAAALGVLVNAKMESAPGRIVRIRARDGIIIQESEERATWTYTARSEETTPTVLIVEHRIRPGWKLSPGQGPAESTTDFHRFRVAVDPRNEATLVVREARAGETRLSVGDVNDAFFTQLAQSGISASDLQGTFRPILEKRAEVAAHERRLADLQSQLADIVRDQDRLRENMKALRGSAEERLLLQRYTRQLDDQENKLESLRGGIAQTTARRDAAREELSKLIAGLTFDVTGPS